MRRHAAGVLAALGVLGCTAPTVTVLRPTVAMGEPCPAPPPREKSRIFAGLESEPPIAEGGLRLADFSVDDRLAGSGHREVHWGEGGKLLTIEQDRAVVWEVSTGTALAKQHFPSSVRFARNCTATRDLSRVACFVGVGSESSTTEALLGMDLVNHENHLASVAHSPAHPFVFAEDGASLIVGGAVHDARTGERRRTLVEPSSRVGARLPHPGGGPPPRRTPLRDGPLGMLGATLPGGLPVRGPALYERLVPFGPRLVRYREAVLDVTATEEGARFHPAKGHVSVTPLDGGAEVGFDVEHPDAIVVLSPSGRWVGELSNDFTLRSAISADPVARLENTGWANSALLSDDGRVLVLGQVRHQFAMSQAGGADVSARAVPAPTPRLEAWDLTKGTLLWKASERFDSLRVLSADGRYLWTPLGTTVVEARTGRKLVFDRRIRSVSPEGVALLDDDWGGTTAVDLPSGRVLLAPKRRMHVVAASRAGHLATRAPDLSLQLETSKGCLRLLSPRVPFSHSYIEGSVAFSEDASTLVASVYRPDATFLAWDADTGAQRYALRAEGGHIQAVTPLREVRVVSTASYPTPLSTPDVVVLDVKTANFVARTPHELPGESLVGHAAPSVRGRKTAEAYSHDLVYAAVADDEGELLVGRTRGRLVGRASFGNRRDHVIFAWFPSPHRLAVQTARGGIFEFDVDPAR